MIHARQDYNRMQDPAVSDPTLLAPGSTPIADDEPVCLFRAQDYNFIDVLTFYRTMILADPDYDVAIVESLEQHIERAREWQAVHGCKRPDLHQDAPRVSDLPIKQ